MRIAVLTPVWKGSKGGGILTYTANVVDGLKALGHTVHIYAIDAGRSEPDTELRVVERRGNAFVLKSFRRMLSERYDGILCNESRFTYPPAAAYALLRRTRVVYVVHSFPLDRKLGFLGRRFYYAPFSLQERGLFRVVFVSQQLKRYVTETFGIRSAERSSVVRAAAPSVDHVGRDPGAVREFRRSWGIQDTDWLVLGLGLTVNEGKAKGAALLILALSRMRLEGQPFKLMLTRKGHPIYWLRSVVQECGLDKEVIFTQEVPDPMLALNACDLYAHVVLDEGLPVSLLEAMSAGKPIIASRRAGIPEAITDDVEGLLIEPTVDAVVAAIRRMRDDPALRARLSEAARRRAASMSWEATTQQYVDLLTRQSI
jgi:glycosyltransferase involved in cell wall biosynthesis